MNGELTMTKHEVIKSVAENVEINQKTVKAVVDALTDFIYQELHMNKKEKITLGELGTFSVKHVPERRGIAQMGEKKEWVKPEHYELCFKVRKTMKDI